MRVERELDPRMVACVPGCAEAREVEPHRRYEARMTQRMGPITLSVPLEVTVSDVEAPRRLALDAKGRDGALGANVYEGGQLLNANMVGYRVPRAEDMPPRFDSLFVENADGPGPFGAKGAGEGSLVPVSPAIGNALARLTGVRLRELPMTPERVWRALRARRQDRTAAERGDHGHV